MTSLLVPLRRHHHPDVTGCFLVTNVLCASFRTAASAQVPPVGEAIPPHRVEPGPCALEFPAQACVCAPDNCRADTRHAHNSPDSAQPDAEIAPRGTGRTRAASRA